MKVFNTSFTLSSEEGTEVTDITKLVREGHPAVPVSAGIALHQHASHDLRGLHQRVSRARSSTT